jgi:GT2 family glycosyltransferase
MKWLDKCFGSLRNSDLSLKTIAVDNGSTDGTVTNLEVKYPEVEIIQPGKNLGFGMGNNVGIKKALDYGADFVFLLNQDAYLLKGSIKEFLEGFNRSMQVGLISPIHLAPDGRNLDFGFYKYLNPEYTPFLLGDSLKGEFKNEYESTFVNAAAWMLSVKMIREIGMFHPAFDHYGEDREYVSRMNKAGYKTLVSSLCCIVHDRPQGRSGNKYHRYGQTITRELLQGLIEKRITYPQACFRIFKLFIRNLVTLELKNVVSVFNGWLWLTRRKRLI